VKTVESGTDIFFGTKKKEDEGRIIRTEYPEFVVVGVRGEMKRRLLGLNIISGVCGGWSKTGDEGKIIRAEYYIRSLWWLGWEGEGK
jgi:hypothetical protein